MVLSFDRTSLCTFRFISTIRVIPSQCRYSMFVFRCGPELRVCAKDRLFFRLLFLFRLLGFYVLFWSITYVCTTVALWYVGMKEFVKPRAEKLSLATLVVVIWMQPHPSDIKTHSERGRSTLNTTVGSRSNAAKWSDEKKHRRRWN